MIPANLRRLLPVETWPDIDRRLWHAARTGAYVATLRPAAIPLIAAGYGRWIAVLTTLGRLDKGSAPDDRVTPDAVRAYTAALCEAGNKPVTIAQRLGQLAVALRIMVPDRSFTWLRPSKLLREHAPPASEGGKDHQLRGWPSGDRQLWQAGMQVGDILAGPRYAAGLRPETVNTIITGYRRWLVFLRTHERLDPTATPAARVTRENVIAYVRDLREAQCNASLIARLSELRCAMQVMHPKADFRWITSPGGRALSSLFPISQTPIQVFGSKALYDWGHRMMQDALAEAHPEKRRIAYRNGLLVALFAARAPRVGSMASLRLGETVVPSGKSYKLVFEKEDVKTGRRIEYHAPAGLSAAITRYIKVERAELLAGQSHNWFWVNEAGEPFSADNISNMIQRQSKRWLGKAFGPHRFRHAIGTTAPLADPAHPGVAAAVLGITGRMVEDHYNRATQADVAHRFHASLEKERARLQSLAYREFRAIRR